MQGKQGKQALSVTHHAERTLVSSKRTLVSLKEPLNDAQLHSERSQNARRGMIESFQQRTLTGG